MGLATYSNENRILGAMQTLGLTADHLAALDGSISPSRLSAAFRGVRDLETPQAERLLRLLAETFRPGRVRPSRSDRLARRRGNKDIAGSEARSSPRN